MALARQELETLEEAAKRVLIHELGASAAALVASDPESWETTTVPLENNASHVVQNWTHFLFSASKHHLEQPFSQDRLPKEVKRKKEEMKKRQRGGKQSRRIKRTQRRDSVEKCFCSFSCNADCRSLLGACCYSIKRCREISDAQDGGSGRQQSAPNSILPCFARHCAATAEHFGRADRFFTGVCVCVCVRI